MKTDLSDIFRTSECPAQEELEAYVAGTADPGLVRQIERHVVDCEICSDTLEGIESLGLEQFKASVDEVKQQVGTPATSDGDAEVVDFKPRTGPAGSWVLLSIAASVSLLLALGILFVYQGGSKTEGIDTWGQWETPRSFRSSATPSSHLQEAQNWMVSGDYKRASQVLGTDSSSEGLYWRAYCETKMDRRDAALSLLEQAAGIQDRFGRLASFQWAVLQLDQPNRAEAIPLLKGISQDSSHEKSVQATKILESVDEQ